MRTVKQVLRDRCFWIFLVVGGACLAAVVSVAVPNGGPWVRTFSDEECPAGLVCADWDLLNGDEWSSCCIDPDYADSYVLEACNSEFRHYRHGL